MKKNLILIAVIIACALSSFAQTQSKQYITPAGDTVIATANTTPSNINYATLSLSGNTVTMNQATMMQGQTTLSLVVHPKVIVPIYTPSGPITLQSNTTYSGLSIDLGNASTVGITGNNVTNVHITNCRIVNTKNFAILLNGCSNITIDNCFISNVGFGVYAQNGSKAIKVNNNQFLNINGINVNYLGHAIQFNGVNGGGSQINNNRIENVKNITDTSSHPHDQINVYQSNGVQGDSIQVIGNWIRGGQLTMWPNSSFGACGIVVGDNSGSYQVCRNNILVNPGAAGIQCNGNSPNIKVDHNQVYSSGSSITLNAFTVLNPYQIELSYNKTNWTNHNGYNVLLADGETQYWLGSPASPTPVNMNTNYWKAAIGANILPTTIITMK